jgi:hypothetical protein
MDLSPFGACIEVIVGATDQRAEMLKQNGAAVPKTCRLTALIDPGTQTSHVDGTCLNQLGLRAVGSADLTSLSTPGQSVPRDLFEVSMNILLPAPHFTFPISRILVFEMYAMHAGIGALIGQDILKNFVFTYNGKAGTFSLDP